MTRQEQTMDHGGVTFPPFTDFNGKAFHNASFRGAVFEGKVTFLKTTFTGTTDFSGAAFKGPADFSESRFEGADFRKTHFADATKFNHAAFAGAADFSEVRFSHDSHFSSATFADSADFSRTEFHAWSLFNSSRFAATAAFSDASFRGSANFAEVQFEGGVNFSSARFIAFADFQRARFQGIAQFQSANLECKTLFREAVFERDANFTDCRFTHPVNFAAARFQAAAMLERVILMQFVDFSTTHFAGTFLLAPPKGSEGLAPELRFENVRIDHPEKVRFANISFEKITLMGTALRGIHIEKPKWPKLGWFKKRCVIFDEIQKEKPDPQKLARLYSDIRANLRSAGERQDLGDLLYSEMEIRRTQRRAGTDSLYFFRRYLSPYTLLWLTCGYGRRPLRALVTAGIAAWIYFG